MTAAPVRRRLDLKTLTPGGGGPPFLLATLVDDGNGDQVIANGESTLPALELPTGTTGLTVADFLDRYRSGERHLYDAARHYGQMLYDGLLRQASELRDPWQAALREASGRGLRLEIRLPTGSAAAWRGQPVASLPFELMCDEAGFLFRRTGWQTVRRLRDVAPRALRLSGEAAAKPIVQVGWANVLHDGITALPEADFLAHEQAVDRLVQSGRAQGGQPLRHATRRQLADALRAQRPHVLVWIGHGASAGSALVLHDDAQPGYTQDLGTVVSAADFARDARAGAVDVAMLWSCHGAGTEHALSSGVAEALLNPDLGGLAAVVASFSALESGAAARFSGAVLDAWASDPAADLEAALARARHALDEQSLTWTRPVLFLRTPPADAGLRLLPALPDRPSAPTHSARLLRLPLLPARSASFIDRLHRVQQVADDMAHHAVVVLEGLPGLGKTELALAIAHQRRQAGEDVAFIDVTGQRDIGNLRAQLGQLVSDAVLEGDEALYRAVADLRWTLVVDNAEDLLTTAEDRARMAALLRGLAAASAGFRCLVTSRRALAPAGADWLHSREPAALTPDESLQLFKDLAGRRLSAHDAEGPELPALLADLGGLPRAIALMVGQLGDAVDVPELRRRLQQVGPQAIVSRELFGAELPEALPEGLDQRLHRDRLVSALQLSLRSVEGQDMRAGWLFDALGVFPAGLAQHLLPLDRFSWIPDALAVLLEHHLVHLAGEERRIMVSAPVQSFAWSRLQQGAAGPDADMASPRLALLHALLQNLSAWVEKAAAAITTEASAQALAVLLAEEPNSLQAITLLTASTLPAGQAMVAYLYAGVAKSIQFAGRAQASLATMNAVADAVHHRWPQEGVAARALRWAGELRLHADDLQGARQAYGQALAIFRQVDDGLGEANSLKSLGDLMLRSDDLPGARQAFDQALPIYRQINARLGEANALKSLGDLMLRSDDLPGARQAYAQALTIYRQINDRLGEANALKSLGDLMRRSADLPGARQAYEQALTIYRQINDRLGEANALKSLGDLMVRTDDLQGARQAYEQALTIHRQINDRLGEANALQALGMWHMASGDVGSAFHPVLAALRIQREIGDVLGAAGSQGYLARIAAQAGALRQAVALAAQALETYERIGERFGQCIALLDLGQSLLPTQPVQGIAALCRSRALARQIGNPMADLTDGLLARLRLDGVDPLDFDAQLTAIDADAERLLAELFAEANAAVQAGEIDLYAVPGRDGG